MSISHRSRLGVAFVLLAAAAVATDAGAATKKPKKHPLHAPPAHVVDNSLPGEDYLNVGAVADHGSDQRYFNDTKLPTYDLGPSIFQRSQ